MSYMQNPKYPTQTRCRGKILTKKRVFKAFWAIFRPASANVGRSKNLGRAPFRKMPEAGLKIAQKGLKKHAFCQNFAEAPSLARVWVGYLGFYGGSKPPPDPPHAHVCASGIFRKVALPRFLELPTFDWCAFGQSSGLSHFYLAVYI